MKLILLVGVIAFTTSVIGQTQITIPTQYYVYAQRADSLFKVKEFKKSGETYTLAFSTIGGKGMPTDRYNAACAWANANYADSVFFNLNPIVEKLKYSNYYHITHDINFQSLHNDVRWFNLLEKIKQHKLSEEISVGTVTVTNLEQVFIDDQKYRNMLDSVVATYGFNSSEMRALQSKMLSVDKVNLIKVRVFLEEFGWLGADSIGEYANKALFLVLQHTSDYQIKEDYLPMIKQAVKDGKAKSEDLAMLEDRVALHKGKKQIYGSQVRRHQTTGQFYVAPIEDEVNVNARRKTVGLKPLEEYLKHWNIDYKLPKK